jgi:hypothetical protein
MRLPAFYMVLFLLVPTAYGQAINHYNTDSLLTVFSANDRVRKSLQLAEVIYTRAGVDTGNISLNAFKFACLAKMLIDKKAIHIKHRHRYRNGRLITVIDFTKKGNKRRFAVIDLVSERLLFDTLVSQGSGKGDVRNDKYHIPYFFSNALGCELSSLGLIGTKNARETDNPCHLCRYTMSVRHKDVVVLEGLEKGINDNIRERDIIIHTTGSKDLTGASLQADKYYHISESECKCYRTGEDGKVKSIAAYASACGLSENNGYIGQGNGCLVLPEDDHIAIMNTLRRKSLIFIYSDVISDSYDYFRDSPIIAKLVAISQQ